MTNDNQFLSNSEVWDLFSDYDNVKEVMNYIKVKTNGLFTSKEILTQSLTLLKEKGFTKEDILKGNADEEINMLIKIEQYVQNATNDSKNRENSLPLKPVKTFKNPHLFKRLVSFGLAVASVTTMWVAIGKTKKIASDNELVYRVSQDLGTIASNNENGISSQNIIDQNKYAVGDQQYAYNCFNIACDIIKISEENLDLFDLCMYDAYFNLELDRLKNMDDILRAMQVYLLSNDQNHPLYAKAEGYNVYLEYVLNNCVSKGIFASDSKEYQMYKKAIENYKANKLINSETAFESLSAYDKEQIENLIAYTKEMRTDLCKANEEIIDDMVNKKETLNNGGKSL